MPRLPLSARIREWPTTAPLEIEELYLEYLDSDGVHDEEKAPNYWMQDQRAPEHKPVLEQHRVVFWSYFPSLTFRLEMPPFIAFVIYDVPPSHVHKFPPHYVLAYPEVDSRRH